MQVTWMLVLPRWCGKLNASMRSFCLRMDSLSAMTRDTLSQKATTPTRALSSLMLRPGTMAREKFMMSSYSASTLPDRSSSSTTSFSDEQSAHARTSATQHQNAHGRTSRGTGRRVPKEFEVGMPMQIVNRFCHVSKFQAPDWLHYIHNAVASLPTPELLSFFDSVFTTSQQCIFNVQQITTSGKKFNIFLARTWPKIPLRLHQNTPFHLKIHFFRGKEPSPSSDPCIRKI